MILRLIINQVKVLNPEKGTYIKGKDTLLGWLVAAAIRYPKSELELVVDMILNSDDSNNNIIDLNLSIEKINNFKDSKRGQWIQ